VTDRGRPVLAARLPLVCAILTVLPVQGTCAPAAIPELQESYAFLTSYRATHGGALYRPVEGPLRGVILPFSFADSEQYWGEYVCRLPNADCTVVDTYDPTDFTVGPKPGAGALLQTERVNVHSGTNIYDAATWQIAVMLGAVVNRFGNQLDVDPYDLVSNENRVLSGTYVAPNVPLGSRATTTKNLYVYNGTRIDNPRAAYAFRMTPAAWLVDDPLKDSQFASAIHTEALPGNNPQYQPGRVSWSDWKPITGDNAWAFLVGPLQAAYLHYVVDQRRSYVPFQDAGVQNAVAVLPAFAAMQSSSGAVYYAPSGTLGNDSAQAVSQFFVSVENNLSLYAGLRILDATLAAELAHDPDLGSSGRNRLSESRRLIAAMIAGGTLGNVRHTKGLLSFLRSSAWNKDEFLQGGAANIPGAEEWLPTAGAKAVDVNTWGVAALGPKQVDDWFGFGAALRIWRSVKTWGAYGVERTLLGVGYSDADGNGRNADGTYRSGELSAEWTAGAIVMVRSMIRYYESLSPDPRAAEFVRELRSDEADMIQGIQALRFDRYVAGSLPGKPKNYANLIVEPEGPQGAQPYLYASTRYLIPFGWYANPLPSTCSTAWVLLVADGYDPFVYGGGYVH